MIVEWRLWWFGRQSSVPLPPDLSAGTLPVDLDLENELINKGRAGASKFHRIMGLLGSHGGPCNDGAFLLAGLIENGRTSELGFSAPVSRVGRAVTSHTHVWMELCIRTS